MNTGRRLTATFAEAFEELYADIANLAASGFRKLAADLGADDYVTLHAHEFYNIDRLDAVFAEGEIVLACSASAGPYTISAGDLYSVFPNGKRFRNITGGSLATSGTLTLSWRAESPGAAYNFGSLSTITLGTPLPGVSATNPSIGVTGTWLTQQGVDRESTADLNVRCDEEWGALGVGGCDLAYAKAAKDYANAVTRQVTRVRVRGATPQQGHVSIDLAGPSGAVGGGVVTDVVDGFAIPGNTPQNDTVHVASVTNHSITITGTATVKAKSLSAAQAGLVSALLEYEQSLDLGPETVRIAKLIELVMDQQGVTNFVLTSPSADVAIAAGEVAKFTDPIASITWVTV
jgi:hypothetical protein